jgi:tetratricopeptide (TPR) repeat protein
MSIAQLDEELHVPDVLAKLQDPIDTTASVHYVLGRSLNMLTHTERLCFTALGIVNTTDYPQDVLLGLFGTLLDDDTDAAIRILDLLITLSLLQPFEDNGIRRARVHPLLHHLAMKEWHASKAESKAIEIAGLLSSLSTFTHAHQHHFALLAYDEALYLNALRQATSMRAYPKKIIALTWTLDEYLEIQGQWEIYNEAQCLQLAAYRDLGDCVGEGITLNNLGELARNQGRNKEAAGHYIQALAILRDLGNHIGEGVVLNNLGCLAHQQGNYEEATKYYTLSLVIQRDLGDRYAEGNTLMNLGTLARNQRHYDEATEYYAQALTIQQDLGNRSGEGMMLMNLGMLAQSIGHSDEAFQYFSQSLALLKPAEHPQAAAITRVRLERIQ